MTDPRNPARKESLQTFPQNPCKDQDPFWLEAWSEADRAGCTRLFWQAPADMPERNLRDVLRHELRCSGTVIRRLRQPGLLMVDGKPARVMDRIGPGSLLEIWMTEPEDSRLVPEPLPLSILYEDDHLIAIDKTDNLPVHPSAIHRSGTLANAVAWHLAQKTGQEGTKDVAAGTRPLSPDKGPGTSRRVRPVTRLDRNTSGVTLFAKTAHAQFELARQADQGLFEKTYLGITAGIWADPEGTLRMPIRRKAGSIIEREAHPDGDPSVTHYEVLGTLMVEGLDDGDPPCSLLRFRLETGRTHQIRVHCAASGHPMLGDTLYGGPCYPGLAGQALHCDQLAFLHPVTRSPIVIHSRRESPMFRLWPAVYAGL